MLIGLANSFGKVDRRKGVELEKVHFEISTALKKATMKCLKLIAAIVHTCCVQTIFADTRCRW